MMPPDLVRGSDAPQGSYLSIHMGPLANVRHGIRTWYDLVFLLCMVSHKFFPLFSYILYAFKPGHETVIQWRRQAHERAHCLAFALLHFVRRNQGEATAFGTARASRLEVPDPGCWLQVGHVPQGA